MRHRLSTPLLLAIPCMLVVFRARALSQGEGAKGCPGTAVSWATYIGGTGDESAKRIAMGPDGTTYVALFTDSLHDFPLADTDFGQELHGGKDVVVAALSPGGSGLLWKVVLGGPGEDVPTGITVDPGGLVAVTGHTAGGFPVTENALQPHFAGGRDVFVARLDPDAVDLEDAIVYATYLGGSGEDVPAGIVAHPDGSLTVAGTTSSRDLPTTDDAFETRFVGGEFDGFVTRVLPGEEESVLLHSSFIGGHSDDGDSSLELRTTSLAVAPGVVSGHVVFCGYTWSTDFPTTGNAYDATANGDRDIFLVQMDTSSDRPPADRLVYGTYLGAGGFEAPTGLAVDGEGGIWLTGYTFSPGFPTTSGAFESRHRGSNDGFVSCLDSRLPAEEQLTWSTLFGGTGVDVPRGLLLVDDMTPCIAGWTESPDLPLAGRLDSCLSPGLHDGFLAMFDVKALEGGPARLLLSSYFGSSSGDAFLHGARRAGAGRPGRIVVGGASLGFDLPGTEGSLQPDFGGLRDAMIAEFDVRVPRAALTASASGGDVPLSVELSAAGSTSPDGTSVEMVYWDMGGDETIEGQEATVTLTEPGRHAVTLSVLNDVGLVARRTLLIEARIPDSDLSPWTAGDVGNPGFPGAARLDPEGSGALHAWSAGRALAGSADDLFFVHRGLEGDFVLTARLDRLDPGRTLSERTQAGLMVREGLEPDARHVCVFLQAAGETTAARVRFRDGTGGQTRTAGSDAASRPSWLRLDRLGDEVTAKVAPDGPLHEAEWSEVGRVALPGLDRDVLVGFAHMLGEPASDDAPFLPLEASWSRWVLESAPEERFVRGDSNDDGGVDLSDAVHALRYLFLAGSRPGCLDSADTDDSGSVDITDAIYLLNHLFLGGPDPVEPFAGCGGDSTEDDLTCASFAGCREA